MLCIFYFIFFFTFIFTQYSIRKSPSLDPYQDSNRVWLKKENFFCIITSYRTFVVFPGIVLYLSFIEGRIYLQVEHHGFGRFSVFCTVFIK
jgi:hypothetical protein